MFCDGSPKRLWWWMFQYLKYIKDITKHEVVELWQTSEETLEYRTGDCEDYAILAYDVLKELNPHIIVVAEQLARYGHAVCTFKWSGYWYHISNWGLKKTAAKTFEEVYKYTYKDCARWYETDTKGKRLWGS